MSLELMFKVTSCLNLCPTNEFHSSILNTYKQLSKSSTCPLFLYAFVRQRERHRQGRRLTQQKGFLYKCFIIMYLVQTINDQPLQSPLHYQEKEKRRRKRKNSTKK
ncbi:hypothetical protein AMTRI_Chr13g88800 [Amborella trichopoda]